MTHLIRCSACGSPVASGAAACSGCGLPLTAQAIAVPVPEKQPLLTIPRLLALAALIMLFTIYVASMMNGQHAAHAAASFATDLAAGRISTPQAFDARCGAPRWTESTKRGQEFHYLVEAGDIYVTFAASGPVFEIERLRWRGSRATPYRVPAATDFVRDALGCR